MIYENFGTVEHPVFDGVSLAEGAHLTNGCIEFTTSDRGVFRQFASLFFSNGTVSLGILNDSPFKIASGLVSAFAVVGMDRKGDTAKFRILPTNEGRTGTPPSWVSLQPQA